MFVYIQSEFAGREGATNHLWTVGHYSPSGKFEPESDYADRQEAAARCHYLNGGNPQPTEAEIRAALDYGRTVDQHLP